MMPAVIRRTPGDRKTCYKTLRLVSESEHCYLVVMEYHDGHLGSAVHAVAKSDYMKEGDDLL